MRACKGHVGELIDFGSCGDIERFAIVAAKGTVGGLCVQRNGAPELAFFAKDLNAVFGRKV